MSALVEILECACNPGKVYTSKGTFQAHKKTQRHRIWESNRGERDSTMRSISKDYEIIRLKRRIAELEEFIASTIQKRRVSDTEKKKVAASQKWLCGECQNMLSHVFEVDHIQPLFLGGTNEESNLTALCRECHGMKTACDRLAYKRRSAHTSNSLHISFGNGSQHDPVQQ